MHVETRGHLHPTILATQPTNEMTHRNLSDDIDILTHCREPNCTQRRGRNPVEPSQGNPLGDVYPASTKLQQPTQCRVIVVEEHGLRQTRPLSQVTDRANTRFLRLTAVHDLRLQPVGSHRCPKGSGPQLRRRCFPTVDVDHIVAPSHDDLIDQPSQCHLVLGAHRISSRAWLSTHQQKRHPLSSSQELTGCHTRVDDDDGLTAIAHQSPDAIDLTMTRGGRREIESVPTGLSCPIQRIDELSLKGLPGPV